MANQITSEALEAFLHCKVKAHLKLTGEQGIRSDYEAMLLDMRAGVRLAAIEKIVSKSDDVERAIPLTTAALKRGAAVILDATLDDLHFDGLKKVDGPSKLGDFHYVPMLFHEGNKVGKEQKLFLEVLGLLVGRLQGIPPASGIIWHGTGCKATKVRLGTDARKVERLLDDFKQLAEPRLILNDHCQVCEFRQRCQEQAIREDNISLLRGLGPKEIKGLARKGILTVTQLAHTFRPRRKGKRAATTSKKRYHALQALAIRDKRIYVFGTPEVPTSPVKIYLDIEGVPDQGFVYLIGMIITEGDTERRLSFWADSKEQEKSIFEQFLAEVGKYDDFRVFCYGSYEKTFLQQMRHKSKTKKPIDRVLNALVNPLSLIYSHIYFPVYSNGLKDIGACLGCSWSEPDASGLQSLVWRMRWEATHDESMKQKLLAYNLEDCAALRAVTDLLYDIAARTGQGVKPMPVGAAALPVSTIQDMDKLANDRKWGKVAFHHPDYEYINERAYFDYQRDRVFVRTSPQLRRRRTKRGSHRSRSLRVTKRLKLIATKCPTCSSTDLAVIRTSTPTKCPKPRSKRAFDLVYSSGGIKRKVIECSAQVQRCSRCGDEFVSEQYRRLDRHFHGLKSWAMFQHVAHRLSFLMIQVMLEEFFGLIVHDSEIHQFKVLMAEEYKTTYRTILERIITGHLLHVDETEVKLKVGTRYVWVFTNLEEVVFMVRPTREADFLKKLLRKFHGVLVSDFYSAYDSIDCPQQKCLIHLMRDMNQELLNNPYDDELQEVTGPFGTLLRAIVSTVDEHGLKRRHLQRHEREVEKFFRHLAEQSFRSEAAETLRERLLRNKERLFTFIHFDGVPWNNNNAENAIKRFAYYRENVVGLMSEAGLRDYLTLLSICHTCTYKGVSFLKFLLSREKDVDAFCRGRRQKKRRPAIELYPKGFVLSHFKNKERARLAARQRADGETAGLNVSV